MVNATLNLVGIVKCVYRTKINFLVSTYNNKIEGDIEMNEIKIKLYLYKNIREKLAEIPADYISSDIPFNFMDVDEFELTIPKYKNDKTSKWKRQNLKMLFQSSRI